MKKFYLGMAIKAGILTGAVLGTAQVLPVLAEELPVIEETPEVEETSVQAVEETKASEQEIEETTLETQSHISNIGWQTPVEGNGQTGTTGKGLPMEAVKVNVDTALDGNVVYQTYSSETGWSEESNSGETSGTTGIARPLEAFRASLTEELSEYYSIYYRAHVSNIGWMGWAHDGEVAGTVGYGNRLEALEFKLLRTGKEEAPPRSEAPSKENAIEVQAHVSNVGWQSYVKEGEVAGTTCRSLPMEAVKIKLNDEGSVKYETFVHGEGWQEEKKDNAVSGTTGKALPIHAIRIALDGAAADKYDVFYRAHVSNVGWMDWVKNGRVAGRQDNSYNLEALQVELREKVEEIKTTTTEYENTMYRWMLDKDKVLSEKSLSLDAYNITKEEAESALKKISQDCVLDYGSWSIKENGGNLSLTYNKRHLQKYADILENYEAVTRKIDDILSKVDPSWSDLEKVIYVADWVSANTWHNNASMNKDVDDHSVVGPLVYGQGVCDGYVDTINTLLYRLGIPAAKLYKESIGGAHVLSQVFIDGSWYNLDVDGYDNQLQYGNLGKTKYQLKSKYLFSEEDMHYWHYIKAEKRYETKEYDCWVIYPGDEKITTFSSKNLDSNLANNTKYDKGADILSDYYDRYWIYEQTPFQYYDGLWYNTKAPSWHKGKRYWATSENAGIKVYQYNEKTGQLDMIGTELPKGTWESDYAGIYIIGDNAYTSTEKTIVKINLKTGNKSTVFTAPKNKSIYSYYVDDNAVLHYLTTDQKGYHIEVQTAQL